jgi:hypothetical protein
MCTWKSNNCKKNLYEANIAASKTSQRYKGRAGWVVGHLAFLLHIGINPARLSIWRPFILTSISVSFFSHSTQLLEQQACFITGHNHFLPYPSEIKILNNLLILHFGIYNLYTWEDVVKHTKRILRKGENLFLRNFKTVFRTNKHWKPLAVGVVHFRFLMN